VEKKCDNVLMSAQKRVPYVGNVKSNLLTSSNAFLLMAKVGS